MYKITYYEKAFKHLTKKIHPRDKNKVLSKIQILADNPFNNMLDIKKLSVFSNQEKNYRLRVGEIRIFYEIDTDKKEIIIYNIDYRRTTTYS